MDRYCGLPKYEIRRNGKTHTLHIYKYMILLCLHDKQYCWNWDIFNIAVFENIFINVCFCF